MSSHPHDWQADFAVFGQDGLLAAVAEAKKKPQAGPHWAAAWFRNYSAHQRIPSPPFVILVTPEKLYLWKRTADAISAEPTAVTDAHRLFGSYFRRSNLDPADVSGPAFELIVGAWLNDLSQRVWQPAAPEELRAFVDTGLLEAVENGRVVADIAA